MGPGLHVCDQVTVYTVGMGVAKRIPFGRFQAELRMMSDLESDVKRTESVTHSIIRLVALDAETVRKRPVERGQDEVLPHSRGVCMLPPCVATNGQVHLDVN